RGARPPPAPPRRRGGSSGVSAAAMGIRLVSVSRHYATAAGPIRAVDGITLAVAPRASLAVTGPSGCGKSTLLGLIAGLEVPTEGRVFVGGREISGADQAARASLRRAAFGLVFQRDNLLPFLTAVENVALQGALSGAGDERSLDVLPRLGVAAE